MPSQLRPQANVNGVHHARVATEATRADDAADRPSKRPLQALPRDAKGRARPDGDYGPSDANDAGLSPRRSVRVAADLARSAKERRPWIYVKQALMHPWHVVVLAGAAIFGVANWSLVVLILVFGGAELVLLGIVLRLNVFRRYVDQRLDQLERTAAAEQRAALLVQMGDEHRRELLRIEGIVDKIRDATKPHGTAAQLAVNECLRLLASYVRLAIAFHGSRECLSAVDRGALDEEILSLEAARFSQAAHTRALAQRRLMIARKRAARWDRSRESLDAIAHQLLMIGELVQLTHEQVSAPADPGDATEEIDWVVEALDDNQATLEELANLLGVEDTIEPRVLDLGRAARG